MSNNKISNRENTLQLPPQFPCTSSSKSESEAEYISFEKRGKHRKENEVPLKKRKIKSLSDKFWFFSFFQNSPVHKTFPCGFDGDLRCFVFLKTAMYKDSKKFCCTL